MVSFFVYDLAFLVLFSLGIFWFLKGRKKELAREGWIFIWRTRFGIEAINWFAGKFGRVMEKMKWLIVGVGAFLMGVMLWMLGQATVVYLLHPEITKVFKAPPIAPLIPYFPKLFGMESIFPPFYFTYFIFALAIVAIAHEFSHGIFMKLFKIKIKSTGLVFLGPMLGAFVEQDEKSMKNKKKLDQMTVMAAGVFANVLVALLFYGFYVGFFFSSFTAAGYEFDSYTSYENVPVNLIDTIEGDLGPMNVLIKGSSAIMNLSEVRIDGRSYLMNTEVKNLLLGEINMSNAATTLLEKSPAVLAGMKGAIVMADDVKIMNHANLGLFMQSKNPGDIVRFTTEDVDGVEEYDVMLAEHPNESISYGYLGVSHIKAAPRGVVQGVLAKFMGFKESSTYYKPTWDGNFVWFIYHFIFWVMIINLLVALFNMLPVGMLDGGRFFYLGILGIFGSEKFAKVAYKVATYLILGMFALMMFFWFIRII